MLRKALHDLQTNGTAVSWPDSLETECFPTMCQVYCSEVTKRYQEQAPFPPRVGPNICLIYPLHQDLLKSQYARIISLGADIQDSTMSILKTARESDTISAFSSILLFS